MNVTDKHEVSEAEADEMIAGARMATSGHPMDKLMDEVFALLAEDEGKEKPTALTE